MLSLKRHTIIGGKIKKTKKRSYVRKVQKDQVIINFQTEEILLEK